MDFQLRAPLWGAITALSLGIPGLYATETDDRIVAAAQNSYNFKTILAPDKINVAVKKGSVTLTGQVQDEFHRALAEETLTGLPGVKQVNNQLNVQDNPGGLDPDTSLRARVQVALLFHRQLSALKTEVRVDKGVVTLQGEAESAAQKRLATDYVSGMEGVAKVVNNMTLIREPHPKRKEIRTRIDDASITARVKMALLFHKATSAVHTKVRTENGIVHLEGSARSQAEKDLVTRIARNIEGVRVVRNAMAVA